MTRTPNFTVADLPVLVRAGRISQADADRVTGKPTPAAETVRKATAQVRAAENAAIELAAQDELTRQLTALGVPSPRWDRVGDRRKFTDAGNWRFDGRIDDRKIAIEIDGGTRKKSRHTSPIGFERDCEKTNEAQLLGWRVFRFTYRMVNDGRAAETIRRAREGD